MVAWEQICTIAEQSLYPGRTQIRLRVGKEENGGHKGFAPARPVGGVGLFARLPEGDGLRMGAGDFDRCRRLRQKPCGAPGFAKKSKE
jgi:hypothetical protein